MITALAKSVGHLGPGDGASLGRWLMRGAAAGAAGTTALNAVTYLDMAVRGRPSSSTPEQTVEKIANAVHLSIPGSGDARENRLSGLGPLMGLGVGTGAGAFLGALHAAGLRLPLIPESVATAVGVMSSTNTPMAVIGISDPRSWSVSSWMSDVLPHAAYGVVTAWTLHELAANRRRRFR